MRFSVATLTALTLTVGGVAAFTTPARTAFVSSSQVSKSVSSPVTHAAGCFCPSCVSKHTVGCNCPSCIRSTFALCATAEETEVPAEVAALDGVEGEDEVHNRERPARKSLKKKGPKGKPLSEFSVGSSIKGKVKSIANYGAFVDIGASTDGLLHISQLSVGFVSNVGEVLKEGQEVDVRILSIDEGKNQVALSLLSEADEAKAKEAAAAPRQQRSRPERNSSPRRDDSAVLASLSEKGWNSEQFVEGTVVSTPDFGAFVRVDASQLNGECEGLFDGLVHISALTAGRAASVTSVVNTDEKVQVRVKAISGGKVSLTMMTVEDEQAQAQATGAVDVRENTEWKKDLDKIVETMPKFQNKPLVVDLRK